MDRITAEQRSQNMRAVGQKNTKPEIEVRRLLHRMGYRFRLHRTDLPGSPDIFLPRYQTAVFVHGCFWHGHEGCARSKLPSTRTEFWKAKQKANRERDKRNQIELEAQGIRVMVVWECELRDKAALKSKLRSIHESG